MKDKAPRQAVTHALVRELLHYDARLGELSWKPRGPKWFEKEVDRKRWNNRYAGTIAFTYINGGRRWGCIMGRNFLAHRVAWLHARGQWPGQIRFINGDATDIRIANMKDITAQVRERTAA